MKIHEYQGKKILCQFGATVPRGIPCVSTNEALEAAQTLGGSKWVVKAQIHAGGRGKGGGIKIAQSLKEIEILVNQMLNMRLVTYQTNLCGQRVRCVLIEEIVDIQKEFYVSMITDRVSQCIVLLASNAGGIDIENVIKESPELIHKIKIDPILGLTDVDIDNLVFKIGIPIESIQDARIQFKALYQAYWDTDASLVEINPLVLDKNHKLIVLDAKFNFDPNALFRHPEILAYRDLSEEDPVEIEASKFDLAYIALDGNIGCVVNGAGLAMATMDVIKLFGGQPANFLDVGGGATIEKVNAAFRIMFQNLRLKAILVNIFGGIMRCDVIAHGLIFASQVVSFRVPLVVRMKGTNEESGRKVLADSHLPIVSVNTMEEAAKTVVALAQNKSKEK